MSLSKNKANTDYVEMITRHFKLKTKTLLRKLAHFFSPSYLHRIS
jgi:hypothetical protein